MGKDVTEDTKGLEKEIEKKIKKRGNKKIQPSEDYMKELRAKDPEKHMKMVKKYFTGMKAGGKIHKMKRGGMVKKCCDGIAKRGKTKGRMV